MSVDVVDFLSVPAFGIGEEVCIKYNTPHVKTRQGVKLAATFSEDCFKVINLDGSSFWIGDYDANMGLFGQKAVVPGKPVIIVPAELEALKLASLGFPAVCLAEPNQLDPLALSVLEENLITVTSTVLVWTESTFSKRQKALDEFLLHLAGSGKFDLLEIDGSNVSILTANGSDVKRILDKNQTKPWKPRTVLFSQDILRDKQAFNPKRGITTGFKCIDAAIMGARKGEVTTVTAGSGVGKSTLLIEIAFHIGMVENKKVGVIFLEDKAVGTLMRLAAIKYNIPVVKLKENPEMLTKKEWDEITNTPQINNFIFNNHFGSLDSDDLFRTIDYMIDHCGCEYIFIDHISIAISGLTSSKEGERKDIDILMTKLTTRAVSKDVGFWLISHLSVPEGKPHEEGGRVTMSQLRGSGSIKQLSFNILAQERNQQDDNSSMVLVRVLKCRETGVTGPIGVLNYDRETGRLAETGWDPKEFEKLMNSRKRDGDSNSGYRAAPYRKEAY